MAVQFSFFFPIVCQLIPAVTGVRQDTSWTRLQSVTGNTHPVFKLLQEDR